MTVKVKEPQATVEARRNRQVGDICILVERGKYDEAIAGARSLEGDLRKEGKSSSSYAAKFISTFTGATPKSTVEASLSTVVETVVFLVSNGMTRKEYAAVVSSFPPFVNLSADSLRNKAKGMGVDIKDYIRMVVGYPEFARLTPESLKDKAKDIGIEFKEYMKIVKEYPKFASLTADDLKAKAKESGVTFNAYMEALQKAAMASALASKNHDPASKAPTVADIIGASVSGFDPAGLREGEAGVCFGASPSSGLASTSSAVSYLELIRRNGRAGTGFMDLMKDQVVVDVGAGISAKGYETAEAAGARMYIAIEGHFPELLAAGLRSSKARSAVKTPWAVIGEDMLVALRRFPPDSVSVIAAAIDASLFRFNDDYLAKVSEEVGRVLHPEGVFVGVSSDIKPVGCSGGETGLAFVQTYRKVPATAQRALAVAMMGLRRNAGRARSARRTASRGRRTARRAPAVGMRRF